MNEWWANLFAYNIIKYLEENNYIEQLNDFILNKTNNVDINTSNFDIRFFKYLLDKKEKYVNWYTLIYYYFFQNNNFFLAFTKYLDTINKQIEKET